MANLSHLYSSKEYLDDLVDRDQAANVIGYVEKISAPESAGNDNDLLFKFILSNGKQRIPILIWGQQLIDKYLNEIRFHQVISISGATSCLINQTKYRTTKKQIPFDIIVKANTVITILGYHTNERHVLPIQQVTFDTVNKAKGSIEISGYLRNQFALVNVPGSSTNYAVGAITDGEKKVNIRVNQFIKSGIELGDFIRVTGVIRQQDSIVTICCENMDAIVHDAVKTPLSPAELLKGVRPLKRVLNDDE